MDSSRVRPRTVALALLCLAVIAFAAATLDTTTEADSGFGFGNPNDADQQGGEREPAETPSGDGDEGNPSFIDVDLEPGPLFNVCVGWLRSSEAQLGLLLALGLLFLVVRHLDDSVAALGIVVVIAYPGFFIYLLLTSCSTEEPGQLLDLSNPGRPSQEGGGTFGGESSMTSPSVTSQLLMIVVLVTLVAVAVLVLTGDHESADVETDEAEDEVEPEASANVAAIGAAAGRAADRIEHEGEFGNEVYRAWAEMTEHLEVDHPESSTPSEFATAAVTAGMDTGDVDRLTSLFEEVRYGGAEPTSERERAAVETLRNIESAYAGEES